MASRIYAGRIIFSGTDDATRAGAGASAECLSRGEDADHEAAYLDFEAIVGGMVADDD